MKRNRQKAMALFLALLMAVSFTACGGSPGESGSDSTGSSNSVSAAEEGGQLPDGSSGNGGMDSTDVSGDRAELTMILINDGMEYPDTGKVGAATAGIVKEKLDIDLSFKYLNFYDASTSLNLWLSSGEGCDIFQAGLEWNSFIDQGFLRDLTPYEELLPDAIKAAGVYLDCGISDGKLYGIPSVKDMVNYNCYFFRKDIVDAVQIDPDSVTSYEELGNLLRAIKAKYPELRPLVSDAGLSAGTIRMDNTYSPDGKKLIVPHIFDFGSSVGLMEPTVSSKVECLFMTDYYEDVVNMAYDWNQEGLIYFSDMSSGPEQVLAGTAAGGGGMYKPGAEVEWGTNAGCEVYAVCHPDPGDAVRTTSTGSNWSVSNGCSDVESACRLINLMFMDKEINNLLAWGIEGQNYVLTDEENVIAYPEGMDSTNATYYNWAKFSLPNNYLQYVMAPNPPGLWERMEEFNNAAKPSKAFGFTFSPSDEDNRKLAEISNIAAEYNPGLTSGELQPSLLQEFREKLKSAGIMDVVRSAQEQLDKFIETQ